MTWRICLLKPDAAIISQKFVILEAFNRPSPLEKNIKDVSSIPLSRWHRVVVRFAERY